MMKRVLPGVILILAAGAKEPVGTSENPWELHDTIVVIANRKPTPLRRVASSVTVVTERQIRESQAEMVADILGPVAGVDVVRSGGQGKTTSVFLRGANSQHTLVLIDGVEMNDPSSPNGSFDFAHLSADNIERIEVLRGSQGVLYGSDAIGGVIQVFTKRGAGVPRLEASAETGTFGTHNESAHLSGRSGKMDYALALSRRDTDGFSASNENLGSTESDGYRNTEGSGRVGLNLPNRLELSLSGRVTDGEADIDQTFGVLDDPNFVNSSTTQSYSVTLRRPEAGGVWTPEIGVHILSQELGSFDDTDSDHPDNESVFHSQGDRIKLTTQHSLHWSAGNTLTLGAETEEERYASDILSQSAFGTYTDTVPEVDSRISSVYALQEVSLIDHLYTTAGVRLDHHREFKSVLTYRVTAAYLMDRLGMKLKGTVGTGFKSPSLWQLFHQLYGNARLQPEESTSWELGVEQTIASTGVSLGGTYFRTDYRDLIALDPATFRSINIGDADSRGWEFFGTWSSRGSSVRVDFTHTDTRNGSDDTPIIRRPENKLSATVSQAVGERLGLNLRVLHVGERKDFDFRPFPAELVSLDSYTLVNLAATLEINALLQLRARAHNLLNEQYEEVFTYGTSSRAVYVGARVAL